jgi:Flp pilus assembly protein protease CpaA
MHSISRLIAIEHWPLWVGLGVFMVAAISFYLIDRIPNVLTVPAVGVGWLVAVALIGPGVVPSAGGGITASLACTFIALGILLPFWLAGRMPGGCVKAQMAYGAWTGCALGIGSAAAVTAIATLGGAILTVALLQLCIERHRRYLERRQAELDAFGLEEREDDRLFPCQLTLAFGSFCGVLAAFGLGFA